MRNSLWFCQLDWIDCLMHLSFFPFLFLFATLFFELMKEYKQWHIKRLFLGYWAMGPAVRKQPVGQKINRIKWKALKRKGEKEKLVYKIGRHVIHSHGRGRDCARSRSGHSPFCQWQRAAPHGRLLCTRPGRPRRTGRKLEREDRERKREKKEKKKERNSTLDSGNPIGTEQYMKDSTDDTHFRPFSLAMPSRFTPLWISSRS